MWWKMGWKMYQKQGKMTLDCYNRHNVRQRHLILRNIWHLTANTFHSLPGFFQLQVLVLVSVSFSNSSVINKSSWILSIRLFFFIFNPNQNWNCSVTNEFVIFFFVDFRGEKGLDVCVHLVLCCLDTLVPVQTEK